MIKSQELATLIPLKLINDKTVIDLVGLGFTLRMKITANYVLSHRKVKAMVAEVS